MKEKFEREERKVHVEISIIKAPPGMGYADGGGVCGVTRLCATQARRSLDGKLFDRQRVKQGHARNMHEATMSCQSRAG
jgi:hypothetical protein